MPDVNMVNPVLNLAAYRQICQANPPDDRASYQSGHHVETIRLIREPGLQGPHWGKVKYAEQHSRGGYANLADDLVRLRFTAMRSRERYSDPRLD